MPINKIVRLVFLAVGIFVGLFVIFTVTQLTSGQSTSAIPGEGQMCGGMAGIECPMGFTCQYPRNPYPDQAGTCRASGGVNISSILSKLIGGATKVVTPTTPEKPRTSPSMYAKDYPITDTDGTIYDCIESDDYGNCTKTDYTYPVATFLKIGDSMRGKETKIIALADSPLLDCVNIPAGTMDPGYGVCPKSVVLRDESDTNRKMTVENLAMADTNIKLSCEKVDSKSIKCNAPFEIGTKYIFTGTLDGEVKYYDNGEPYIVDTFKIKKFEPVK